MVKIPIINSITSDFSKELSAALQIRLKKLFHEITGL